ncbi:hypothetical protein HK105_203647 [Polyrhizophydium stewartii]|uniref:WAPL domain-containing protein n=1 Tax=Polyrhizophydium stewartii TaxID=2732419 RepID=A0ABR4NBE9_9FUNG
MSPDKSVDTRGSRPEASSAELREEGQEGDSDASEDPPVAAPARPRARGSRAASVVAPPKSRRRARTHDDPAEAPAGPGDGSGAQAKVLAAAQTADSQVQPDQSPTKKRAVCKPGGIVETATAAALRAAESSQSRSTPAATPAPAKQSISNSLGALDALFDLPDTPSAQPPSTAKRVAMLKMSRSASTPIDPDGPLSAPRASNFGQIPPTPTFGSASFPPAAAAAASGVTPSARAAEKLSSFPEDLFGGAQSLPASFDGYETPSRSGLLAMSPSKSSQRDGLTRSSSSPGKIASVGRIQKLSNDTQLTRLASRHRSGGLTFGANRTVMAGSLAAALGASLQTTPSGVLGHEATAHGAPGSLTPSIEDILAANGDDGFGSRGGLGGNAANQIDEGLSSSDDEGIKVRSIHELRQAGETQRFKDEMQYFIDGLAPQQQPRVRKCTAIELCRKLTNEKFVGNIRAHTFTKSVFELLTAVEDPVMQLCVSFLLWALSRDVRNIEPLFSCETLAPMIVTPVAASDLLDPLMTAPKQKSDRVLVDDVRGFIAKSSFWTARSGEPVSTRLLAIDTLAEMTAVQGFLAAELRRLLCETNALSVLVARIRNLEESPSWPALQKHLRILEFATVHATDAIASAVGIDSLLKLLLNIVVKLRPQPLLSGIVVLALRVSLNLSNSRVFHAALDRAAWIHILLQTLVLLEQPMPHPANSEAKASGQAGKPARKKPAANSTCPSVAPQADSEPTDHARFDLKIVCLSLLTNLIALDASAADAFASTTPAQDLIAVMLRERIDVATKTPDAFILSAHIAMLFGCALKQSDALRAALGQRGWADLVAPTAALLADFSEFHEHVAASEDAGSDPSVESTRQLIAQVRECLERLSGDCA